MTAPWTRPLAELTLLPRYPLLSHLAANARVLDIGGLCTAGVDFWRAHARPRALEVWQGEGAALPFADAAFDLALCHDLPARLQAAPAWMAELRRVLAPGGSLCAAAQEEAGAGHADLQAALAPLFTHVSVWGQAPLVAGMFFDFAEGEAPGLSLDRAGMPPEEVPHAYLLMAGPQVHALPDISLVQLPLEVLGSAGAPAPGAAATAGPSPLERELRAMTKERDDAVEAIDTLSRQLQALEESHRGALEQVRAERDAAAQAAVQIAEQVQSIRAQRDAAAEAAAQADEELEAVRAERDAIAPTVAVQQQQVNELRAERDLALSLRDEAQAALRALEAQQAPQLQATGALGAPSDLTAAEHDGHDRAPWPENAAGPSLSPQSAGPEGEGSHQDRGGELDDLFKDVEMPAGGRHLP